MKILGILGAIAALICLLISLQMDVTVSGYNNLGLIADRQNYLITSCVGLIVSFMLIGFGFSAGQKSSDAEDEHKCPFCAESIKKQAIVCRFCGKDLPTHHEPKYLSTMQGLFNAITDGSVDDVVNILSNNPKFINQYWRFNNPLHIAAMSGHIEICEILLKLGADRTIKNNAGKYPSEVALEEGFKEIAELLAYGIGGSFKYCSVSSQPSHH